MKLLLYFLIIILYFKFKFSLKDFTTVFFCSSFYQICSLTSQERPALANPLWWTHYSIPILTLPLVLMTFQGSNWRLALMVSFGDFFFMGGGCVKGVGDNNTVHNVNEHYILKDETIKEFGFYIYVGCFFTNWIFKCII